MNEILKRTLFGAIFVLLVVGSILISQFAFSVLMLFVVGIGEFEMMRLFNNKSAEKGNNNTFAIILGLCIYTVIGLYGLDILKSEYLVLLLPLMLLPFLFALFNKKQQADKVLSSYWSSVFYVALPSGIMVCMFNENILGEIAGAELLILILSLIWINDIFAYLVGMKFGKHRLFERISPKKSWEGSIGGLIFTMLSAGLFAYFTQFFEIVDSLVIALIVVIFGSLGDLTESMFKRQAGVKDSGNLIPGHGGILDRFDATFFAVPFVFVYLMLVQ